MTLNLGRCNQLVDISNCRYDDKGADDLKGERYTTNGNSIAKNKGLALLDSVVIGSETFAETNIMQLQEIRQPSIGMRRGKAF